MSYLLRVMVVAAGLALLSPNQSNAQMTVRIKDITTVEGVRSNEIMGIGLVTGLNKTGGKAPITRRLAAGLTQRLGIREDPERRQDFTDVKTESLSAVMVVAKIPPFARPGSKVDVTVTTIDDASSIQGGFLVRTVLKGIDGKEYGTASGPISIGGFSFGGDAASVQKNHPTVGRIPNGLYLEEPIHQSVGEGGCARLLLRHPDFTTATRIATAINTLFPGSARSIDPGTVSLNVPADRLSDVNSFISDARMLRVQPDIKARVVINERTGTVIVGKEVRLGKIAITHANLAITTSETPQVSQPNPLADGTTAVVPRTEVNVVEERRAFSVMEGSTTVGDLASALNALGVAPRDLSSIFQQLKVSGALHAEIEFQ